MPIVNRIADFAEDMKTWRHWMHRNPEVGFDLPKTAAFVAARLREIGVDELHEGIAQTGMVAIINGQAPGPTIGLRADMDALPILEATGAAYASETPGKMHACGHDGHTTMLLGAARYLAETRNFKGRVALIFQPAEEAGSGGKVMVDEGIMERFAIGQVYAMHNAPDHPVGTILTTPGPIMAGSDNFTAVVHGRGGHAAFPHDCIDPIPPVMALAQGFSSIVSRNANPQNELVISLTRLQAGTANNIVPASAMCGGTVRTFDPAVQAMVMARMQALVEGTAAAYGVTIDFDYRIEEPPTVNDADAVAFALSVAAEVVGTAGVNGAAPRDMGAEDFAYMLQARPGAYVFLGQGSPAQWHDPAYDFNDAVAPIGASYFARLVERAQPLG